MFFKIYFWQNLAKQFSITNGLNKRWCGIDLMNQSGKSWGLSLRHNNVTGQDYIRGGWRSFCRANNLKTGSLYRFIVVRNGTRPMLRLCSNITPQGNGRAKVSSRKGERASMDQNKFLTVTLKPYMLKSRQLVSFQHLRFRVYLIKHFLVVLLWMI